MKLRYFFVGFGVVSMMGILSKFFYFLSFRVVFVEMGMWMSWGRRCFRGFFREEGWVISRWFVRFYFF